MSTLITPRAKMNAAKRQRPRTLIVILRIAAPYRYLKYDSLHIGSTEDKTANTSGNQHRNIRPSAPSNSTYNGLSSSRYPRRRPVPVTRAAVPRKHYSLRRNVRLRKPDYGVPHYLWEDEGYVDFYDEDEDDSEPEIEANIKEEHEIESVPASASTMANDGSTETQAASTSRRRSARLIRHGDHNNDQGYHADLSANRDAHGRTRSRFNTHTPVDQAREDGPETPRRDKYGLRSKNSRERPDYYCPDESLEDAEDDRSRDLDNFPHSAPGKKTRQRKKQIVGDTTAAPDSQDADNAALRTGDGSEGGSQANPILLDEESTRSAFATPQISSTRTKTSPIPLPYRHRPSERIADTKSPFEQPGIPEREISASFSPAPTKDEQIKGPIRNPATEQNIKKRKPPLDNDPLHQQRSQRHKQAIAASVPEAEADVEAQKLHLWAEQLDLQENALALRAAALEYQQRRVMG